jgi:hypothetical protein
LDIEKASVPTMMLEAEKNRILANGSHAENLLPLEYEADRLGEGLRQ